jgi:hypothetical protein
MIILFTVINAIFDYELIKRGKKVNHTLEALIRGVIIALLSLGDQFILTFIFNASVFWIIFELLLNISIKQHPLFVGTTATTDKIIRRIFPINTGYYLLTIKLIICVTTYFLISG